jgi:periodic tryptophan protein 2
VGNRVTVFDLENSKSVTLPFENGRNISCVALSPNGKVLITVDEEGRALLINYKRGSVLSRFNFKSKITCISFSPCGQFFAASHGKNVQIWGTPSLQREYAPFVLHRTFAGHFDEVLCIDWAADGSHLISGSRDLTARIVSLEARDGFPVTLAGHRESVIAAYLGRAEGSAITVTRDGAYIEWRRRSEESSPSQSKFWAYIALTTGLCADGQSSCVVRIMTRCGKMGAGR